MGSIGGTVGEKVGIRADENRPHFRQPQPGAGGFKVTPVKRSEEG